MLAFVFNVLLAGDASAHVKWFCAYDVAGQPRGLENVLCPDFELLVALAIIVLLGGCFVEGTPLGDALARALDRVMRPVQENTELLFRAGCGFFFVALWTKGGILLTPELTTTSTAVSYLQLAIAAGMLSRQTMPLSALGIVFLFGLAMAQYGAFHLADYPIFLGVAAYLALTGLKRNLFGLRPLDVVRWAAAITLMWASVEKWAYPQWSFPLFAQYPGMTLGFDQEFFMRAAGVIEFTLAFALLWTPLVNRMAAILLAGMFISATFEFGKLDIIGHALIVVALLTIAADNAGKGAIARYPVLAALAYGLALGVFLSIYYVAHSMMFGTSII